MTYIGVTGHQRLENPDSWAWVGAAMRQELLTIERPLVGVTSLAAGADQFFAQLVLDSGGALHVVLPFADIERTLSREDLLTFLPLKQQATVEVLETPGTDEDAYLAAGQRVVQLSDLLIAVWDGKRARGRGGTADVVALALQQGVPLIHLNPDLLCLVRITPGDRASSRRRDCHNKL